VAFELPVRVHGSVWWHAAAPAGVGAGAGGAAAWVAAAVGQRGLVLGGPGVGQLGDELAQVLPGDAGEARMGKGRTDPCWSSHPGMIVRPSSCRTIPAINPRLAYQVVP